MREIKERLEASKRGPLVHGEGDLDAGMVLVGEAPGSKEVELGRPFVGQAGKNLDAFLKVVGLERKAIYITNVVKIRPFRVNPKTGRKNNRPPSREEVGFFSPFLKEELDLVAPLWVVTLGNTALKAVAGMEAGPIGEIHGEPLEVPGKPYRVFPLYHPAAVIYNRSLKPVYEADLLKLKSRI